MSFTLSSKILRNQSIETLVRWYNQSNIIDIEKEIGSRLSSCNSVLYNPIINFLFNHQDSQNKLLNSVYIRDGLNTVMNCIDWKIGVIYDYTSISLPLTITIIVGNQPYRYPTGKKYPKGYFKPSWLVSDKTKLMLREVISKDSKPKNNVITINIDNVNLDNHIRSELLSNNNVLITVCNFNNINNISSYPNNIYLTHREIQQIYPCIIESPTLDHDLIKYHNNNGHNYKTFKVSVTKTDTVKKLILLVNNYN